MDPVERLLDAEENGEGVEFDADEVEEIVSYLASLVGAQDDLLDFLEDMGVTVVGRRSPEEAN